MADVVINTFVVIFGEAVGIHAGPIYTDANTAYVFWTSTTQLLYDKTSDGGATWAGQVVIDTEDIPSFAVWFDQHTRGDAGTMIHIAWVGTTADDVFYRNLDTSDDSLGIQRTVFAGASAAVGKSNTVTDISISKALGGNLYIQFWIDPDGEHGFYRSTDAGAAWTIRTDGADGDAPDRVIVLPDGDAADNQDMAMVYWDASAQALSIKKYDNSGNGWTETEFATGFNPPNTFRQFDAMVRHSDDHIIVVGHERYNNAASDYKCYDITLTTPTIAAKTDIITATANVYIGAIFIDQLNDDLYAVYLGQDDGGQTAIVTVDAHYKVSTDGGASWGAETTYSEDTADDLRAIWTGRSTPGNAVGRFGPMFLNEDLDDIFVNVNNSVEIVAAAAAGATSRMRLLAR